MSPHDGSTAGEEPAARARSPDGGGTRPPGGGEVDVANFPWHHSRCVASLSFSLARESGLSDREAAAVRAGALLHDLGKIGVPSHILRKPGKLNAWEWQHIIRHPLLGATLLHLLGPFLPLRRLVLHHHERWDGTGYPGRLKGTAIPVASRIISVADAFHAMTSDRPYRAAMTTEQALKTLDEGSGTQWEPRLVGTLCVMVQRQARTA